MNAHALTLPWYASLFPDPNVETMHLNLINTLLDIGVKFCVGIKMGEACSRSGAKVVKDFIYALDQFIVGGLHAKDVPNILLEVVITTGLLARNKPWS
jgi:hypothetical protein